MQEHEHSFFFPIGQLLRVSKWKVKPHRRTINPDRFPLQIALHSMEVEEKIEIQGNRKKAQSLVDQFHRTQRDNAVPVEDRKHFKVSYIEGFPVTITRDK